MTSEARRFHLATGMRVVGVYAAPRVSGPDEAGPWMIASKMLAQGIDHAPSQDDQLGTLITEFLQRPGSDPSEGDDLDEILIAAGWVPDVGQTAWSPDDPLPEPNSKPGDAEDVDLQLSKDGSSWNIRPSSSQFTLRVPSDEGRLSRHLLSAVERTRRQAGAHGWLDYEGSLGWLRTWKQPRGLVRVTAAFSDQDRAEFDVVTPFEAWADRWSERLRAALM